MNNYERTRLLLEPFLQSHYYFVRKRLAQIVDSCDNFPEILDVGGRESPYTLGVDANIVLSELPREAAVQHELNLGITPEMWEKLQQRRTNIKSIVIDDMITSQFEDDIFDCVVAVEVLEHVEEDRKFLEEVNRVLKPGGIFLMTTPNGDCIPNTNPDHKRHYKRTELQSLLCKIFDDAEVLYAVRTGILLNLGWIKRFSIKRPFRTFISGIANSLNLLRSIPDSTKHKHNATAHLFATAVKPDN